MTTHPGSSSASGHSPVEPHRVEPHESVSEAASSTLPAARRSDRYRQTGTVLTEHQLSVPLDHHHPDGEHIEIFAREVVGADQKNEDLPWLLFLQGGPGGKANRPSGRSGWLDRALQEYRVLLLDQRGTGRSSPVNRQTLPRRGDAHAQAEYLTHFRADSIVRDAELVRQQLLGPGRRWAVLGQSFGGFCVLTYLSLAPEGLSEAFVTGGLPGLDQDADTVYRAAYPRVERKNAAHYARYPQDVEQVRRVARHLLEHQVVLEDGTELTVQAFQSLGVALGRGTGSDELHYLLEEAFVEDGALSDTFLSSARNWLSLAGMPLYAVLQESLYAQGTGRTAWAAERVREEFPQFDAARALQTGEPVLFTGEMFYPWAFRTDPALRPLRDATEELAAWDEWPALYDAERLARNEVPTAAAVYHDDMYVDTALSLETASRVGGMRTWVTNEYEHDGLGADGFRILDRLIRMARGCA